MSIRTRPGIPCLLFVAAALLAVLPQTAEAIPAFARKYKTSCTTCHIAVPMRNAFGEAFRRNGYEMPADDAALIKQDDVRLGADEWKDEFPNTIWPGVIPPSFPISAYVHERLVVDIGDAARGNRVEFDMPHEFEIFVGMNFGGSIAAFGEFILFEKGANVGVGKNGLKRLFFQFNDLVGPENALNVRAGRLEPGITDGYSDNNRMDLEHALTVDYKATGRWRPRDQQSGIEINGVPHPRFQYALGVVNGEKKTISDATDEKDVYFRVGTKLGGMGLDGSGEDLGEGLRIADNWRDDTLQFGVYFYSGNEMMSDSLGAFDGDFTRFGFDADARYDRLNVRGGFISGTDDHNFGRAEDPLSELDSSALFVEVSYLIKPWLIPMVRFGKASSEVGDGTEWEEFVVIDPTLTILARPNVRLTLQLHQKDTQRSGGVEVDDDRKWEWLKTNVMIVF